MLFSAGGQQGAPIVVLSELCFSRCGGHERSLSLSSVPNKVTRVLRFSYLLMELVKYLNLITVMGTHEEICSYGENCSIETNLK